MEELYHSAIHMRFCMVFQSLKSVQKLTQKEFGEKLGYSQNQISNILAGKRNVPGRAIQSLWHVFRVDPDFILKGRTPMFLPPKHELIPIIADIPAGDWKSWVDSYPPGVGDGYLEMSDVKGDNLFAVRVIGDSMECLLHEGDILVIDPHREFIKGMAVVRHHWGFKIRMVHKHNNSYILTPMNSVYEEEEITPDDDTRFYVPVKVVSVRNLPGGG